MDAATSAPAGGIDLASERPFRVGRASIDPVSREATFDSQSERLQPQNLKVLIALVRNRGKVTTRDQLIDLCWDGRFVGDDVINRAISTLRQFAERAGGFSIETVPRSGYRLIEGRRPIRRAWWIAGASLLLVAILIAILVTRAPSHERTSLTIGLLPFETSATDPTTRAIAFAAHDSLSHALARTRFALTEINPNARQPPAADFLISADVSTTPEKIVATVRMEDAGHRIVVYSQRFAVDRDKAWTLPEFIGPQVAGSLGWTEPLLLTDHRYPSDPAIVATLFQQTDTDQVGALIDYDRARRLAMKAPESAVAQFALALDAAFALYDTPRDQRAEVVSVGRAATNRAARLAPEFGGSDVLWCLLHGPAQAADCEDRLRATMRRDPDTPWADFMLAQELKVSGRIDEAVQLAKHSLAADEFIPEKIGLVLRTLEATGQTEEAEQLYRHAQIWWPDNESIFWDRVYGMMDRGDFEAIARFKGEVGSAKLVASLEPVPPLAGAIRSNNAATVRKVCPLVQPGSFKRDLCMLVFARLGDNDSAFALASQVFQDRIGHFPAENDRVWLDNISVTDTDIVTASGTAPLRRDPRYLALARRTGLLAYWRTGRPPDFCRPPQPEPICAQLRPR